MSSAFSYFYDPGDKVQLNWLHTVEYSRKADKIWVAVNPTVFVMK